MQPLVICLLGKKAGAYFRFRKIEKISDVYEQTCEKADMDDFDQCMPKLFA